MIQWGLKPYFSGVLYSVLLYIIWTGAVILIVKAIDKKHSKIIDFISTQIFLLLNIKGAQR